MTFPSFYFLSRLKSYGLPSALTNWGSPGLTFKMKKTTSCCDFLSEGIPRAWDACANLSQWNYIWRSHRSHLVYSPLNAGKEQKYRRLSDWPGPWPLPWAHPVYYGWLRTPACALTAMRFGVLAEDEGCVQFAIAFQELSAQKRAHAQ